MSNKVHAAIVLAVFSSVSMAAPLRWLSDARSVTGGGAARTETVREFDDGSPPEVSTESQLKPLTTFNHPPDAFGSFDHSVGLSLRTEAATADGQGYQVSTVGADGFDFHGVADSFVSTSSALNYGPGYTDTVVGTASASARSRADWAFAVDAPTTFRFVVNHGFYGARGGSGEYSFTGDNGFAFDDLGESQFTRVLQLGAGSYSFHVDMSAGAFATSDQFSAGRVDGDFTLTVSSVPEPGRFGLLAAGLAGLGAAVRRRRMPA